MHGAETEQRRRPAFNAGRRRCSVSAPCIARPRYPLRRDAGETRLATAFMGLPDASAAMCYSRAEPGDLALEVPGGAYDE